MGSKLKRKAPSYNWKVYSACGVVFLAGVLFVSFDKACSDFIHWESRLWHSWIRIVTYAGDGWFLLSAALLFALLSALRERNQRRSAREFLWKPALLSGISFVVSGLIVQILKFIFGRPRPFLYDDIANHHLDFSKFYWFYGRYDFASFPSGHATAVFSVAWVIYSLAKTRKIRSIALLVAGLAALTRVMLGKHYLADIVAGGSLGVLVSQFLLDLFRFRR